MTEQDKKYVIEALEYALDKCFDVIDGNTETHYNTLTNALEVVKNCSTLDASQRYTDKDMDAAYDKGYMDGAHTTSDPY